MKWPNKPSVSYAIVVVFMMGWVWSLLYDIFSQGKGAVFPWSALLLALQHAQNTHKENVLLVISFAVPFVFIAFLVGHAIKMQHIRSIFGNAHWATLREIKKMDLFNDKNPLVVGEAYGKLLRAPLISHGLVFAPSRSGKGAAQVIPNALAFPESMLLIDIKDEIFQASSGFRQYYGQEVYSFAPMRPNQRTHRWNPLQLIDKNSSRLINDIDLIAETLIGKSHDHTNSMWIEEARTLFKGLLLWLMDSDRPFTLGELINFIKGTPNFSQALKKIRDGAISKDGSVTIHPIAFTNINNFIEKAAKEQSGVKSTLTAKLNLWDDPLVQAATECSDFDMRAMRKKKMTIYLGIPVDQLNRLAPLMNLFIQLFLNHMTQQLPTKEEPYKVLVMLDEFCALGRMDILKNGFGFLAGFNVHLMAIIQNVGQFYDIYGGRDKSDTFFQNTDYKIAYRQNDPTDRELVSNLCGIRAIKNRTKSYSANVGVLRANVSEGYISKPLITADEVGRFPAKLGIAIFNGQQPIKYKKIIYYEDVRFKARLLPAVEIPLLQIKMQQLKVTPPPQINSEQQMLKLNYAINKLAKKRLLQERRKIALKEEEIVIEEEDLII